jgi:O-antigen/teichoic acid export membrane protein
MSMLKALQLKFSRALEIDRAVFYAIIGKIWSMSAGLVTTLLIAVFFSPELQGYYYTFGSVLAFQAFAELGLGTVIISYASHEWAKLALDRDGRVTGDPDALSRLASLARFAFRWYFVAGSVLALVLAIGGLLFFARAGNPAFAWEAPWIVLCVITGLNLCAVPIWALLEGCNQVAQIYGYRVIQSVASSIAAWVAIYLGAGLWVASITVTAGLLAMMVVVARRYGRFVGAILLARPRGPRLHWRTDIWPMQWRIAMSWVGGYFAFSVFTPVLFHYQGPVVAGQMGMTWVLVGALMAVASSWIMPKAPHFGILIAQQKYRDLDRLFWRIASSVLAVTAAGAIGIWLLVYSLNQWDHAFAARLLPLSTTGYLLLGTLIVCATLPMSVYLRAHKKEPLVALSLISGALTAIAVVILGKHYSADGVALGYLIVMATVTPFVALIWRQRRAEWHGPAPSPRAIEGQNNSVLSNE